MNPKLWDLLERVARRKLTLDEVERFNDELVQHYADDSEVIELVKEYHDA